MPCVIKMCPAACVPPLALYPPPLPLSLPSSFLLSGVAGIQPVRAPGVENVSVSLAVNAVLSRRGGCPLANGSCTHRCAYMRPLLCGHVIMPDKEAVGLSCMGHLSCQGGTILIYHAPQGTWLYSLKCAALTLL